VHNAYSAVRVIIGGPSFSTIKRSIYHNIAFRGMSTSSLLPILVCFVACLEPDEVFGRDSRDVRGNCLPHFPLGGFARRVLWPYWCRSGLNLAAGHVLCDLAIITKYSSY